MTLLARLRSLEQQATLGGLHDNLAYDDALRNAAPALLAIAEAAKEVTVAHTPEHDTDPDSPADFTGRHTEDCPGCALADALDRLGADEE